jgi:cytochrome c-type protein NapC
VPKETGALLTAKLGAVVDLYSHFVSGGVDTREKFEKNRYRMAEKVWIRMKETDSRECRNCHNTAAMSGDLQAKATKARHESGVKNGKTCIDCHFGVAHNEPTGGPGPQEMHVRKH